MTIKTHSYNQHYILDSIKHLHCGGVYEADISYGKGGFYKHSEPPELRYDISPQVEGVTQASSTALPVGDASLSSIVFDPPFLTYVRAGREGNGKMVMAKQFAGYWRYDELEDHYQKTLDECKRVIRKDGVLVFKCQDIIHNHKMHCTHANVIDWASERGFRLLDLFVLTAKSRMPIPENKDYKNRKIQKHARIHHSYFLVFKRLK